MFGVYVQEQREALKLSYTSLYQLTNIPPKRLKDIEKGLVSLKDSSIEVLKGKLQLSEAKLETMLEVARVGFIDQFMDLSADDEVEK